jgi:hypothetical protein
MIAWDSANVKVKGAEGSHYSRYTLIEEDTKQPQSIETNEVVQTLIDQPKIQPQEEEVDLFKM